MARNLEYEKSPIRGSSKYEKKNPGDLVKDRCTSEMILVIERDYSHCLVQYVGQSEQEKLATWFIDYECDKV